MSRSQRRRSWTWAVAVGYVVVVAAIGLGLSIVGNILRSTLCVGGGSECKDASPISEVPGTVLYLVGSVLFVASPIVGVLLARRRRARAVDRSSVES